MTPMFLEAFQSVLRSFKIENLIPIYTMHLAFLYVISTSSTQVNTTLFSDKSSKFRTAAMLTERLWSISACVPYISAQNFTQTTHPLSFICYCRQTEGKYVRAESTLFCILTKKRWKLPKVVYLWNISYQVKIMDPTLARESPVVTL